MTSCKFSEGALLFLPQETRSESRTSPSDLLPVLNVADACRGIATYLNKYNHKRPHQTLGHQTPVAFYEFELSKSAMKAA